MKLWRKPLDADKAVPSRFKVCIIPERCKGCGLCIEFCPREVLDSASEFNSKGYHPPCVKDGAECIGCELCNLLCPDFAIFTEKVEDGKESR